VGDRADEAPKGREERRRRVDCCETGPVKSAFEAFEAFEGEFLPLEDHCLKPSTELE